MNFLSIQHFPMLLVVLPLLAAPLCSLLRPRHLPWLFTVAACLFTCAISWLILFEVYQNGTMHYHMGNWAPPVGIAYRVDLLNAFIACLVSTIAAITIFYADYSVLREIPSYKESLFYTTFLLCLAGLLGIVMTDDVFNLYVFLEISSLATYALIAMGKDKRSLLSSFEYLILGTIGATFILIAIGLLYMATGSLNISDLANRIEPLASTTPVLAALAFFTIGFALKIAIFPLHIWLTNAYATAPTFVSVFLSATATKVGIYGLFRVLFSLFGLSFAFDSLPLEEILTILSVLAILIGSFCAMIQQEVRRMLAFSSVAHVGYMLLAIVATGTALGLQASLLHMAAHAMAKSALFMAAGALILSLGAHSLKDIAGTGRSMPWTITGFALASLSLIGIPGTLGFISKWYLLKALLNEGNWLLVAVVLISSLMAVVYVWRVIEAAFFTKNPHVKSPMKEAPLTTLFPLWCLSLSGIVFGFYPEPFINLTTAISKLFF